MLKTNYSKHCITMKLIIKDRQCYSHKGFRIFSVCVGKGGGGIFNQCFFFGWIGTISSKKDNSRKFCITCSIKLEVLHNTFLSCVNFFLVLIFIIYLWFIFIWFHFIINIFLFIKIIIIFLYSFLKHKCM